MNQNILKEGQIIVGPLFNEPMQAETVRASGDGAWTVGLVGTQSEKFRRVNLSIKDLETLTILDSVFTYDGNGLFSRTPIFKSLAHTKTNHEYAIPRDFFRGWEQPAKVFIIGWPKGHQSGRRGND